jgi:hypothetical protein
MKLCIELTFSSAAWINFAIEADETPWDSGVALGSRTDCLSCCLSSVPVACGWIFWGLSCPNKAGVPVPEVNKPIKANETVLARMRKIP